MSGCQVTWGQGRSWFCSVRADEPLTWRDLLCLCLSSPSFEGREVMILWSRSLCKWKGTLLAGTLVFLKNASESIVATLDKKHGRDVNPSSITFEMAISESLSRRDVWVKALRTVNLISLKPCNTEILNVKCGLLCYYEYYFWEHPTDIFLLLYLRSQLAGVRFSLSDI